MVNPRCIIAAGSVLLLAALSPSTPVQNPCAAEAVVSTTGAQVESSTHSPGTTALIERLSTTNLVNGDEVYRRLGLNGGSAGAHGSDARGSRHADYLTGKPYEPAYRVASRTSGIAGLAIPGDDPSYEWDAEEGVFSFPGQEPVLRWHASRGSNTEVCGARFLDRHKRDYRLQTFPDAQSALSADHVITHRYHCGTCSSLRDLAVYMARPDLTSPVRTCARKATRAGVKACLLEGVGFDERCAETWAYNVLHTRRRCRTICIEHYGFWNVVTNNMDNVHTDAHGNLNPCLACDEHRSGPGFQYAAGRTRRTSGLQSAIPRPATEIYAVDHSLYFKRSQQAAQRSHVPVDLRGAKLLRSRPQ